MKPIIAKYDLLTARAFIKFCEKIGMVVKDLHLTVRVPKLEAGEEVADRILSREEADAILTHLREYEYATQRHVTMHTFWKTVTRASGLLALDLKDFDEHRLVLQIRHRPDTGTPLKNKRKSKGT